MDQEHNDRTILNLLHDISSLAHNETDTQKYINKLCNVLTESGSYHGVWIALFSENKIKYYSYSNINKKIEEVFKQWNEGSPVLCLDKVLNSDELHVLHDAPKDCMHCQLVDYRKSGSVFVKKINGNNIDGVICTSLPVELSKNENEKLLFETLVLNIELALVNIDTRSKINKENIDELKEDKAVFEKIFKKGSTIKLIINPRNGKIVDCNESAIKFYNYSYNQLKNLTIYDISTSNRESIDSAISQARNTSLNVFRFKHKLSDSTIKEVEMFISPITIGNIEFLLSNIYDITEKIKFENTLRESEARYNSLFQNMINGVSIYKAIDDGNDFVIVDYNKAAKKVTKKNKNQILNKRLSFESPGYTDSKLFKALQRVHKTGNPEFIEPHYKKNHLWEGWQENFIYKLPSGEVVEIFNDVTDREKSLMSLNIQKEDFRYFFNSLKDIVLVIDLQGKIIHQNITTLERLGYTKQELHNKPYLSILNYKNKNEAQSILKGITSGIRDTMDIPLKAKDKSIIPVSAYSIYGYWQDQDAIFIISVDQSELKKSEEKYKQLAENATDIIWTIDLDLNYTYLSPTTEKIIGYKREELKKMGIAEILTKESFKEVEKVLHEKLGSFDPSSESYIEIELDLLHRNGSIISTETNAKFITKDGQITGIQGSTRDITEKRETKKLLVDSERDLKVIFDNAPAIMILLNENSEVLKINKKGYEYAIKPINDGVRPGKILNCISCDHNLKVCGKADGCSDCGLRLVVQDAIKRSIESFKKEVTIQTYTEKSQETKTFLVSTSIISNQPAKKILLTIDDITDRKKILNELQLAKEKAEESDKLKSIFMENISHEIRTPMNSIMGFAQLLPKYWENNDKRTNYINYILDNSTQLLRILDDIIDISTMDIGDMIIEKEVFEIHELLDYVYDSINKIHFRENVQFRINLPVKQNSTKIFSDKTSIIRILNNLIENAFKFTHEGYIEFGYHIVKNKINFFVKDSGIGIDKKFHNQIFERFRQIDEGNSRSYGGVGLGLAICKQLAELMNGEISLASTPNKGSEFTLTIPYNPVIIEAEETKEPKILQLSNISANILIVEDEISNYKILEEVIQENIQANLFHAMNGKEAIDIVRNNNIDLILMDIKMPVMDGYEATRIIRSFNKQVPIIAQTAYALMKDELKTKRSGFNNFINKPIDIEAFLEILYVYLKQKKSP